MRCLHGLVVVLVAAGTCGAAGHGYAPTGPTSPLVPRTGTLDIASYGIAELAPSELPAMPALHVRFVVGNDRDAAPWELDVRELKLQLDERYQVSPLFVNSDMLGLPRVVVRRGERRMFDLYFGLPATVADDRALDTFRIHWAITTSEGRHAGVASFARLDASPRALADARGVGWGPRWWCDPAHPWPLFHRRPGPIMHRPPASVTVRRAPAGQPVVPR